MSRTTLCAAAAVILLLGSGCSPRSMFHAPDTASRPPPVDGPAIGLAATVDSDERMPLSVNEIPVTEGTARVHLVLTQTTITPLVPTILAFVDGESRAVTTDPIVAKRTIRIDVRIAVGETHGSDLRLVVRFPVTDSQPGADPMTYVQTGRLLAGGTPPTRCKPPQQMGQKTTGPLQGVSLNDPGVPAGALQATTAAHTLVVHVGAAEQPIEGRLVVLDEGPRPETLESICTAVSLDKGLATHVSIPARQGHTYQALLFSNGDPPPGQVVLPSILAMDASPRVRRM